MLYLVPNIVKYIKNRWIKRKAVKDHELFSLKYKLVFNEEASKSLVTKQQVDYRKLCGRELSEIICKIEPARKD